jgi:hypothetical protein
MILIARGKNACSKTTPCLSGTLSDLGFDCLKSYESMHHPDEWLTIARLRGSSSEHRKAAFKSLRKVTWINSSGFYDPLPGFDDAFVERTDSETLSHPISVFSANVKVGSEQAWDDWYPQHVRVVLQLSTYTSGVYLHCRMRSHRPGFPAMMNFMTIYELAGKDAFESLVKGDQGVKAKGEFRRWEREGQPLVVDSHVERFVPQLDRWEV